MDITTLFKACVDIARKQNKEFGTILDPSSSGSTKNGFLPGKPNTMTAKSKLFPGKKSEYYLQAKDLLTTLTGLQKYLKETRSPYLNIGSHSEDNVNISIPFSNFHKDTGSILVEVEMTNADRDQIDQDVQKIIQTCQKRIFEFSKMIETTGTEQKQPQLFTHLESISASLGIYLKEICVYYSEMRAIRVKRTIDFQSMAKLSTCGGISAGNNFLKNTTSGSLAESKFSKSAEIVTQSKGVDVEYQMSPATAAYFEDDEELSPEEIQILEAENVQLFNELNTLSDEVDEIQSNVIQIAQLQTVFTEKVLQQEKDIEGITNRVVGATENIKGGNEQIRQAIQQSADFRAWVLFFIIVMSLSLLFLDWYNE